MSSSDLLVDAFGRIREIVHRVVTDLDDDQLGYRFGGQANSIAWLIWHLTRIQDDHVAGAADIGQVWLDNGWERRFGLPLDAAATGYAHSADEVAVVRAPAQLLLGYHDAVYEQTIEYVSVLDDADLVRVVDEAWDPPVTLGVRLISVISDDLQHAGQAAFVRGLLP